MNRQPENCRLRGGGDGYPYGHQGAGDGDSAYEAGSGNAGVSPIFHNAAPYTVLRLRFAYEDQGEAEGL